MSMSLRKRDRKTKNYREQFNSLYLLVDITSHINRNYLIAITTLMKNYTNLSLTYPIEIILSYELLDCISL